MSYENSITYDESIIVYMVEYATIFMALNKEIENFYKFKGLNIDGRLLITRDEKRIFLGEVKATAVKTFTWALDKRQEDIETGKVNGIGENQIISNLLTVLSFTLLRLSKNISFK